MAIKTTPLTDTQIKSLKATNKDKKYFDGGGNFFNTQIQVLPL